MPVIMAGISKASPTLKHLALIGCGGVQECLVAEQIIGEEFLCVLAQKILKEEALTALVMIGRSVTMISNHITIRSMNSLEYSEQMKDWKMILMVFSYPLQSHVYMSF